ncbi:hypothetical protein [Polaromonas sp. JS666]|uniref:hypothetical protein n=1 Tax=Polaromonas sp. (strain JS666 / ATCC BAA-500) TaxID=296591 RepID=UPI00030EBF48|nr:hypothetical protein [Polaromonas sp. JS666]
MLINPGALWIGAHWSPFNRRWCINLVPFVTLWIALKGGKEPDRETRKKDRAKA